MENVTSIKNLLNTFKYSDIELNNEEQATLNSIFSQVDKWDKNGKARSKGDGYLNAKEYYLFSQSLKEAKELYEKFTKTGVYVCNQDRYNLENLFLIDSVDTDFFKSLPEKEVQGLINNISFERNGSQMNNNKAKQFFSIQLQLLKNNNCYTKDLEELVNMLAADYFYDQNDMTLNLSLDSLKKHINDRLAAAKNNKVVELKEPNGKIDVDFKQGHTGDCWLLASIKALASDEKGLEKLNNMISIQKNSDELVSVTVHLQNKDYVISSEELHSAIEYSAGDLDVRALEIAANRFCLENSYKDITDGGHSGLGYAILMCDAEKVKEFAKINQLDLSLNANFENDLRAKNRVGTIGGAYPNTFATDVETGEKVKLVEFHEYAITGSDGEFVYLSNSHDSSQNLKLEINNVTNTFAKGLLYEIT